MMQGGGFILLLVSRGTALAHEGGATANNRHNRRECGTPRLQCPGELHNFSFHLFIYYHFCVIFISPACPSAAAFTLLVGCARAWSQALAL